MKLCYLSVKGDDSEAAAHRAPLAPHSHRVRQRMHTTHTKVTVYTPKWVSCLCVVVFIQMRHLHRNVHSDTRVEAPCMCHHCGGAQLHVGKAVRQAQAHERGLYCRT